MVFRYLWIFMMRYHTHHDFVVFHDHIGRMTRDEYQHQINNITRFLSQYERLTKCLNPDSKHKVYGA